LALRLPIRQPSGDGGSPGRGAGWACLCGGVPSTALGAAGAAKDLDCVLPLRRLQELSADGIVGKVAATHYSFMGYILQPTELRPRQQRTVAADQSWS
jgi:hypothetical protein